MEITLDGGEITIIKTLGLGGGEVEGEVLLERLPQLEPAELLDTLKGLLMMGYVSADKSSSLGSLEDMKKLHFRVNSGYSKDLKEALDPKPQTRSKRIRRE
jgi:hypothetical protein